MEDLQGASPAPTGMKVTNLGLKPQYDEQTYWLILATTTNADARLVKREPTSLAAGEMALALIVRMPKRRRRTTQTVVVTMPDEFAQLDRVEVSLPNNEAPK